MIVHVAQNACLQGIVSQVPKKAKLLMDAFWPGPLTLVMPKGDAIPEIVSAGLDTVAVRCPQNDVAQRLLLACGVPVAAPSANLSGRPSPTTARHVYDDLKGRIPLILDGGLCRVGLESTVLDISKNTPVLLRPGGVTREMLEEALGEEIHLGKGMMEPILEDEKAPSPGMKHVHYAPRAKVRLVSRVEHTAEAIKKAYKEADNAVVLCMHGVGQALCGMNWIDLGQSEQDMAQNLFAALRRADDEGYEEIILQGIGHEGIGLAVMNRALRAAGFETIGE